MNHSETAELLAAMAAFDQRTVGEEDVVAWQAVLDDLPFHRALTAVRGYYATETRRMMPADVRKLVIGAVRLRPNNSLPDPVPDCDPDDVGEYLRQLRVNRRRVIEGDVIDGEVIPQRPEIPVRYDPDQQFRRVFKPVPPVKEITK